MRRLLPLAPLFALAGILLARMAAGGYLHGDDAYIHTAWAQQFLTGIDAGALYPRWVAATNAGCGSPSFVFYPPLVFYSYLPWDLFTDDVPAMMLLSAAMAVLVSGLAMYGAVRTFAGPWTSAAGACLYMLIPYHLLDLCYRAAMAELWAFGWAALALWGALLTAGRRAVGLPVMGLAVGGLLLTHLPSAVLVGGWLAIYAIHAAWYARPLANAVRLVVGVAAGFAVAAVYLGPLVADWDLVSLGAMSRYAPAENFLFTRDAWDPELNRRVTAAGLAALGLCLVAILDAAIRGRNRSLPAHVPGPLFAGLCGVGCFLLMLRPSLPLWESLPVLPRVGFPWRLLVPMSLLSTLAAAHVLHGLVGAGPTWRRWLLGVPLALAVGANGVLGTSAVIGHRSFERSHELDIYPSMPFHELEEDLNALNPRALSLRDVGEYRPRWSVLHDPDDPLGVVMPSAFFRGERAIFSGGGGATLTLWEPEQRQVDLGSERGGQLLLRLLYYPSWQAIPDRGSASTHPHPDSGLLVVDVPSGARSIELVYRRGWPHLAGAAVSAISVAGLVTLGILALRRRRGHPS